MIKIYDIVIPSIHQWESVIKGMRNPMNSWGKSDSIWDVIEDPSPCNPEDWVYIKIGENDLKLMRSLVKAGSDHRKFLRQLPVIMDVTAPLYWWKEADTYKVGTVANSCSTMHKIQEKEFALDDFSHDHLSEGVVGALEGLIYILNTQRDLYNFTKDKQYWWNMIQLLPSSYNQTRTWSMNYEVLYNIYQARKEHKLDEWREFCRVIVREIPYFAEIFEIEEKDVKN